MLPHSLAQATIVYLHQGIALLSELSDEQYVKTAPPLFSSGVGCHIRHSLDHVSGFLEGRATGRIDYDERRRESRLEVDRHYAINRTRNLIHQLECVGEEEDGKDLLVKMDCGLVRGEFDPWSRSSVRRELQFLISHTIHHYALIALILRHQGCDPAEEFGIAPSTLRYRAHGSLCVR